MNETGKVPATAGAPMPAIGLGTYGMDGDACRRSVASALEIGYRLFDCAEIYGNEAEVGAALAESGIIRDDLFVISKFWFTHNSPGPMRDALSASLDRMGLDHVDLYMLHWPSQGMDLAALLDALRLEKENGRIRHIGICNFPSSMLRRLLKDEGAPVDAVELEWHAFLDQKPAYELLRSRSIPLIAYSPLAQGRVASDPTMVEIAERHGVSAGTVALAWLISNEGVVAIPKAVSRAHQQANLAAQQVRLTAADIRAIDGLPKDLRLANFSFSPEWDE